MNVTDVSEELAAKLRQITNLRVTAYHPDKVNVPAAFPDLPETVDYDQTYGRGLDAMTVPIIVMVGRVNDRASHEALQAYMDGFGPRSIKANVDSAAGNDYISCHDVCVQSCTPMIYTSNGINYLAAEFPTRVIGKGGAP
jgi:hypothetical protein